MTKKILFLTGDYVEDYEMMVPFQALTALGYECHAVCPNKKKDDTIKTAVHSFVGDQTYAETPGHPFTINFCFEEAAAQLASYAALWIPGGRAPEYIRLTPKVLEIVKAFNDAKKPIVSICHGVQLLTAARVIEGRTISAYYACQHEVELAGGVWSNLPANGAITDANFVTGPTWLSHPAALKQFLALVGATVSI